MINTFVVRIGGEIQEDRKKIISDLDKTINDFFKEIEKDQVVINGVKEKLVKQSHTETVIETGLLIKTVTYNLIENPEYVRSLQIY